MRHSVLNMIFLASYLLSAHYGAEYLIFVSSRSLKMRENYTNWDNLAPQLVLQLCMSLAAWAFIFKRKYTSVVVFPR